MAPRTFCAVFILIAVAVIACEGASDVIQVRSMKDWNSRLRRSGRSLVVAQFHTKWCPYCRYMQPTFRRIATQHDNVMFLSVDADEQREVTHANGIRAVPTYKFYKNGRPVDSISTIDESRITSLISQLQQ